MNAFFSFQNKALTKVVALYAIVTVLMFGFVAYTCVPQIIATWNN